MGFFDRFRRTAPIDTGSPSRATDISVGSDNKEDVSITFNNRNITFRSALTDVCYDNLLRDKQNTENMIILFKLADYFVDEDPLFRGIVKEVYTPFATVDRWLLNGGDEQVKKKYEAYYERIRLRDFIVSVFYQYFKYANVYIYLMPDGSLITLPVHLCRIANVAIKGEPVVEFNCRAIRSDIVPNNVSVQRDYVSDDQLETRLKGYPPEVIKGVRENRDYVQLNPENTFVLQDLKEDWMRYAVPLVATCLKAFEKKELISNYEDALLKLGMRSFVHVKYGDTQHQVLATNDALHQVSNIFRSAMTGSSLAVTNEHCTATVIQPDTKDMFEYDKYKGVNADILAAGGISGIIVSGRTEDGSTFATAQVSMQTAAMRIKQAKDNFCEIMDRINRRLNNASGSMTHSNADKIPRFTFPPVDLSNSKAFSESCLKLWKEGVLSTESMLQSYSFDYKQEVERKKREQDTGEEQILLPADKKQNAETTDVPTSADDNNEDDVVIGRPTLDDSERHSDPSQSVTGRQPKGSNPEGSEAQDGGIDV